jgi:arylsulfatase A-like enzyme
MYKTTKILLPFLIFVNQFICIEISNAEKAGRQIVLLITIDSLRTDSVGSYNPEKQITPNLDKFANKSFQFSNAYSPANWTKPAMASMLTSRYFSQHGLGYPTGLGESESNPNQDKIAEHKKQLEALSGIKFEDEKFKKLERRARKLHCSFLFLPELMGNYRKAGFTSNPNLLKQDGFERGWDEYQDIPEDSSVLTKEGFWESTTRKINEQVLRFIDQNKSNNVFIWAHYNGIHYPYGRKGQYAKDVYQKHLTYLSSGSGPERILSLAKKYPQDPNVKDVLVDMYEAGIRQFDQELGELFSELEKRKISDQMLIIVTSDHGEEFFEHGEFKHGNNLYNETISIPFLVKVPGESSYVVVSSPISLLDVAPTILDFANTEIPRTFVGKSLMPIFKGQDFALRPIFSEHGFAYLRDYAAVIFKVDS